MFTYDNEYFYATYQETLRAAPLELINKIEWVPMSQAEMRILEILGL